MPDIKDIKAGDVCTAKFPYLCNNGQIWKDENGHPKFKYRPAVLIRADKENDKYYFLMVTSHDTRYKYDTAIEKWSETGLHSPSVVRTDRVVVMNSHQVLKKIGSMQGKDLTNVIDLYIKAQQERYERRQQQLQRKRHKIR